MFGRKEIIKDYYLKIGNVFIAADPWKSRAPYPPTPGRNKNLNLQNMEFTKEESEAWKTDYKEITELQNLFGGEVFKVTTKAERVL